MKARFFRWLAKQLAPYLRGELDRRTDRRFIGD